MVKRHSPKLAKPAPSKTGRTHGRTNDVWTFVLIFCASVVSYWPALQGAMLWDDSEHVTSPELQSLRGLWRIWTERGVTQQYYRCSIAPSG